MSFFVALFRVLLVLAAMTWTLLRVQSHASWLAICCLCIYLPLCCVILIYSVIDTITFGILEIQDGLKLTLDALA
jgi:hypothetical protein